MLAFPSWYFKCDAGVGWREVLEAALSVYPGLLIAYKATREPGSSACSLLFALRNNDNVGNRLLWNAARHLSPYSSPAGGQSTGSPSMPITEVCQAGSRHFQLDPVRKFLWSFACKALNYKAVINMSHVGYSRLRVAGIRFRDRFLR